MAAIKSKSTHPERIVRRYIRSLGYKYNLNRKNIPGKPDIFIQKYNTVVFIHGCFWHQHKKCRYAVWPKTNKKFWNSKLKRNIERDRENNKKLKRMGYRILNVWECEVKRSLKMGSKKLIKKLDLIKS